MSFDATRSAWAARDAGAIEGGPTLLVALAMADRADRATGGLVAGTRGLAALVGVSHTTVTAALRDLEAAGAVEVTEPGRGRRATRWRWLLGGPPSTGSAHRGDNGALRYSHGTQASAVALPETPLRANLDRLACQESNETRTRNLNQGAAPCGQPDDEAPVDPAEVPERVAELRERMGGRSRQARHLGPPLAPTPEHYADDDDGRPFDMTKPEHYGEAAR